MKSSAAQDQKGAEDDGENQEPEGDRVHGELQDLVLVPRDVEARQVRKAKEVNRVCPSRLQFFWSVLLNQQSMKVR